MSDELNRLLLGIQRALLDAVTPVLRAVTVDIKEDKQVHSFYYDCEITDELFDLASVASTEASCSLDYFSEDRILKLEFPIKIPIDGRLVYLRNEPNVQQYINEKYEFDSAPALALLLLYMQQALLGKVSSNLRTVSVEIEEKNKSLGLYFVFDGAISAQDQVQTDSAMTEATKSFQGYQINRHIKRIDFPEPIPTYGQRMAYARKE